MQIGRALYDTYGGQLEARVAAFVAALDAHRFTEGIPAPIEDPLVEALARSGETIEIVDAPPPPGSGPNTLTRRQIRLWLAMTRGIPLTAVDTAIADLPEPDRTVAAIEWSDATLYERSNPLIDRVGLALGLTPAEIDQGFSDAREQWP